MNEEAINIRLEAPRIVATLDQLVARIQARFPESNLSKLCAALVIVARKTERRAEATRRPIPALRLLIVSVLVVALFLVLLFVLFLVPIVSIHGGIDLDIISIALSLEASLNLIIIFGAAIWFIIGLERRHKRGLILKYLHELRSLAHVVDMHQLTKDPNVILNPQSRTPVSPEYAMSEFELARYLNYCSEMLAHIGKLAALYAESLTDSVVIEAVNDLETLTTDLGRKIWQKIMIIGKIT